ncbi:hypothetical protein V6N13_060306 [Hibiscus sabdariffa]
MEKEVHATSTSMVSLPELFSQTAFAVLDCIHVAKAVITQIEIFEKFSNFMDKITLILKDLSKSNANDSESLRNGLDILNTEIKVVKQLAHECGTRNRVYLLINYRKILKQLENRGKEISKALNFIKRGEIHGENMGMKNELEEFKVEIQGTKAGIDSADARRMEQIVELLEVGDVMPSYEKKAKRYQLERDSLGTQLLQALRSFYCSITMDVMVDPVEISSGQTFERSAIERWFADGNKERISKEDHAMQLSRSNVVQDAIGTIQGCIFLVVTMLSSDDAQASIDSRELLDNLSFLDQNVIEMVKANFFKPLLHLLSSGVSSGRSAEQRHAKGG